MTSRNDSLIIVAAGNNGANGFSTVLSPGLSKNALTVGASESERDTTTNRTVVTSFSSRGPSGDGRIKPDVLAPGRRVVSAQAGAGCAVFSMQGTSMATPVVSGSAAIVRQYFVSGYYPSGLPTSADAFVPTGALLKAALVNSAVPMRSLRLSNGTTRRLGLPPDNIQGHGRIKLDDVLNIRGSRSLFAKDAARIAEGETHVYKFGIPRIDESIRAFKVRETSALCRSCAKMRYFPNTPAGLRSHWCGRTPTRRPPRGAWCCTTWTCGSRATSLAPPSSPTASARRTGAVMIWD
jgi:hypothetical protein